LPHSRRRPRRPIESVPLVEVLPALHERREVLKLDRLDLLPERRQRAPASDLDHPSRAPLEFLNLTPEFSAY
jgi:hypothetical protein